MNSSKLRNTFYLLRPISNVTSALMMLEMFRAQKNNVSEQSEIIDDRMIDITSSMITHSPKLDWVD